MEAPIQEIASKIRLLTSDLSNVCDVIQAERSGISKMCREFRVFLKAKEHLNQKIDVKTTDEMNKINPTESVSLITQSELAAVQSLLEETKLIRKREFQGTETKKSRSQPSLKKEIKSETSQKKKTEITGAIPKHQNFATEITKSVTKEKCHRPQSTPNTSKYDISSEVKKLLKSYEETMKSVQTRLAKEEQLSGCNQFLTRLNLNTNPNRNTAFTSKSNNQFELTTYTYKELKQLTGYSQLVYSLWRLQLDIKMHKMLIDLVIPLIKSMNTKDGYFLHLIRCIFALLKDDNTDFPVFLKDNL